MKKIILMMNTDMFEVVAKCNATGMCNASDYAKCINACIKHAGEYPMSDVEVMDAAQHLKESGISYDDCYQFMLVDLEDTLKV